MEQYRQISFKEAMELIADDKLDILYFKTPNGIDCIKRWKVDVESLKDDKWYKKEWIK